MTEVFDYQTTGTCSKMIQVKINDAADTEHAFTMLMGDKVEPRREFIQSHALEVKNLDI